MQPPKTNLQTNNVHIWRVRDVLGSVAHGASGSCGGKGSVGEAAGGAQAGEGSCGAQAGARLRRRRPARAVAARFSTAACRRAIYTSKLLNQHKIIPPLPSKFATITGLHGILINWIY